MNNGNVSNAKILIVDDQEPNLRLLQRILRHGGYVSFRTVQDSRNVLPTFAEWQPDLILLDLMMPHLDGVAVLNQLRPLTEGTYLPVVILTADVTPEARRRALAAGAKDFLTKPFDALEVRLRIKNLLETRCVYRQLARRAQDRIQEQAAMLDRANDAILVEDLDGLITYWSQGAERTYGWAAADAVGRSTRELIFQGPATAELETATQTVLQEGHWVGELPQVTREGDKLSIANRWSLMRDESGQPRSLLIVGTDVTHRKKLEARLADAQHLEAIGHLAGGVAHDFIDLLTVINGCSELSLAGIHRDDPAHGLIQDVLKAGNRAARLTRQLLTFSRRQMLKAVVMDLNAMVAESESLLRRLLGRQVKLNVALASEIGAVQADPGQLGQVLVHLVVNARDAMPAGGDLTIETANVDLDAAAARHYDVEAGPFVTLSVRDTGSGMDEATLNRSFEPFSTTSVDNDVSLGLATIRGIVRQNGGVMEASSKVGEGTTFKVYLPVFSPAGRET